MSASVCRPTCKLLIHRCCQLSRQMWTSCLPLHVIRRIVFDKFVIPVCLHVSYLYVCIFSCSACALFRLLYFIWSCWWCSFCCHLWRNSIYINVTHRNIAVLVVLLCLFDNLYLPYIKYGSS